MDITTTRKTRTTYSVERVLDIAQPGADRERGLFYRPDCDEAAYRAARSFHNDATAAIRAKAKKDDLPVELHLSADDRGIVATCSGVVVS